MTTIDNTRRRLFVTMATAAWLCIGVATTQAVSFGFENITHNGPNDVASQLSVTVEDAGAGYVLFTFSNSGPLESAIANIYFDDGTLLGQWAIFDNPPDVIFKVGSAPKNLPAGTTVAFQADFADSTDGPYSAGVNPGESVGIVFELQANQTYLDTINAILSGDLRIGLHVRGIEGNGANDSDSFVNNGHNGSVPDSGVTLMLLGLALTGLAGLRRRLAA